MQSTNALDGILLISALVTNRSQGI